MAPEVFKHRKYDKKVDVFSFAMILYEVILASRLCLLGLGITWYETNNASMNFLLVQMLEGDPPLSHYEPYEAAKYVAEGHRPMFRAKGFTPELKE